METMLGKIVILLVGMPERLGVILDLLTKLASEEGAVWFENLAKFLRKEPCWVKTAKMATSILRLISDGRNIAIRATIGTRTIAQATDVFTWGIDSDFKNWGLDVPGEAKPETPVEVYEMENDGDFKTIFGSLGRELDGLCLTQEQVIAFVEDHKDWLRKEGFASFFLLKVGDGFFVANVALDSGERPSAYVNRFSNVVRVWHCDRRHRFVVPQALEP